MKERHLLALSGGKDSAALAVYMKEKYPNLPMEYVFIDSGYELPETYTYLERIKAVLGIEIIVIGRNNHSDRKDFIWWLKHKNYYLPSPKNRWCTEVLKLFPFSQWIKNYCGREIIHNYVGLRFDEKSKRSGFQNFYENMVNHYPFYDDGLNLENIKQILKDSGLGFPDYYVWRSRSGCYFCFYQTKKEWIGLYKNHPNLFFTAAEMEKKDLSTGKQFTWNEGITLIELINNINNIDISNNITSIDQNKSNKLIHTLDKIIK